MKQILITLFLSIFLNCSAQPIEFVVSASAGGPNDTVTRKIVEKLEKATDLQFVIINKPGAAHTIAYSHVLNSNKPTLIMSTPEVVSHEVYPKLDELYNAGYFSNTLFVSERSGIRNLKQLAKLSKTRELNFGHGGVGTYSYAAMELVCKDTLKCLGVPYKSGSEGMLAVMTGQIDAYALASYGSRQFLENDKVLAIHEIKTSADKSWFKLFAKNISNKDRETIISILKAQDAKFYSDMGFSR